MFFFPSILLGSERESALIELWRSWSWARTSRTRLEVEWARARALGPGPNFKLAINKPQARSLMCLIFGKAQSRLELDECCFFKWKALAGIRLKEPFLGLLLVWAWLLKAQACLGSTHTSSGLALSTSKRGGDIKKRKQKSSDGGRMRRSGIQKPRLNRCKVGPQGINFSSSSARCEKSLFSKKKLPPSFWIKSFLVVKKVLN